MRARLGAIGAFASSDEEDAFRIDPGKAQPSVELTGAVWNGRFDEFERLPRQGIAVEDEVGASVKGDEVRRRQARRLRSAAGSGSLRHEAANPAQALRDLSFGISNAQNSENPC